MRADRLLSILLLLQLRGKVTTGELAERLEVSERTILRDMEALSAAGVPVYAERGAAGGWLLAEGYRTTLTGMNKEEAQTLLLAHAEGVLKDLGMSGALESALLKLQASLPPGFRRDAEDVRRRIHVDGAGWHNPLEPVPYLPLVQEAVWEDLKLRFRYPRSGQWTERTVEPLGLVCKATIWYLVGLSDGEPRTFRVSRIAEASVTDETFERPADFDLAKYWESSTERFKAELPKYPALIRLDAKLLPRLRQARYVETDEVQEEQGGKLLARVDFQTPETACERLLSWGTAVEVVEPEELRRRIGEAAEAIAAIYRSAAR